jgi:hypothetical protein
MAGTQPMGTARPPATNGQAIAALVLGIVGLVMCGPLGIGAIVCASNAKKQIRDSDGAQGGEGFATAGLILGIIAVVIWAIVLFMIFGVALLGKSAESKFSRVGESLR